MLSLLYLTALGLPQTDPAALYTTHKIWSIGLHFSAKEWAELEPKGSFRGFGPPQGGSGGGFAPPGSSMLLAPSFLKKSDTNFDGSLSQTEFVALGEKWFATWDTQKTGRLDMAQLTSGLNKTLKPPTMSLQAPEGKRNGVAGMMGLDFKYVHATLTFENKKLEDVAVRYKGNGTYLTSISTLKRPFKVDINKYVKDQSLAGVHTLNLHNAVADPSGMNDVLAHRFFRDAGVPSPRTSYARVALTVEGLHDNKYLGLYEIVEEIGTGFLQANFGNSTGALFKPTTPELFDYQGESWKRYNQTYDPKQATEEQKKRLIALCKLITQGSNQELTAQLGSYIDLDAFAKYMAALVCVTDLDGILGPGQNLYLYLNPKTNKFSFIPWDYDQSWGQFGMRGTQQQREQLSIEKPWQGENRFLERVFALPAFRTAYKAQLKRLSTTLFTPTRIAAQVDALAPLIRPAIKDESAERLEILDLSVAGKPILPKGPFSFGELKPIKAFLPLRAKSLEAQLAGKSNGLTLSEFSFPGPGGPGGNAPQMGTMFAPRFFRAFDTNSDGTVTRTEVTERFTGWFMTWSNGGSTLTEAQLRAGLDATIKLPAFGPPPGR
jgi:spore coat protein H